jgi:hypothetical protein
MRLAKEAVGVGRRDAQAVPAKGRFTAQPLVGADLAALVKPGNSASNGGVVPLPGCGGQNGSGQRAKDFGAFFPGRAASPDQRSGRDPLPPPTSKGCVKFRRSSSSSEVASALVKQPQASLTDADLTEARVAGTAKPTPRCDVGRTGKSGREAVNEV